MFQGKLVLLVALTSIAALPHVVEAFNFPPPLLSTAVGPQVFNPTATDWKFVHNGVYHVVDQEKGRIFGFSTGTAQLAGDHVPGPVPAGTKVFDSFIFGVPQKVNCYNFSQVPHGVSVAANVDALCLNRTESGHSHLLQISLSTTLPFGNSTMSAPCLVRSDLISQTPASLIMPAGEDLIVVRNTEIQKVKFGDHAPVVKWTNVYTQSLGFLAISNVDSGAVLVHAKAVVVSTIYPYGVVAFSLDDGSVQWKSNLAGNISETTFVITPSKMTLSTDNTVMAVTITHWVFFFDASAPWTGAANSAPFIDALNMTYYVRGNTWPYHVLPDAGLWASVVPFPTGSNFLVTSFRHWIAPVQVTTGTSAMVKKLCQTDAAWGTLRSDGVILPVSTGTAPTLGGCISRPKNADQGLPRFHTFDLATCATVHEYTDPNAPFDDDDKVSQPIKLFRPDPVATPLVYVLTVSQIIAQFTTAPIPQGAPNFQWYLQDQNQHSTEWAAISHPVAGGGPNHDNNIHNVTLVRINSQSKFYVYLIGKSGITKVMPVIANRIIHDKTDPTKYYAYNHGSISLYAFQYHHHNSSWAMSWAASMQSPNSRSAGWLPDDPHFVVTATKIYLLQGPTLVIAADKQTGKMTFMALTQLCGATVAKGAVFSEPTAVMDSKVVVTAGRCLYFFDASVTPTSGNSADDDVTVVNAGHIATGMPLVYSSTPSTGAAAAGTPGLIILARVAASALAPTTLVGYAVPSSGSGPQGAVAGTYPLWKSTVPLDQGTVEDQLVYGNIAYYCLNQGNEKLHNQIVAVDPLTGAYLFTTQVPRYVDHQPPTEALECKMLAVDGYLVVLTPKYASLLKVVDTSPMSGIVFNSVYFNHSYLLEKGRQDPSVDQLITPELNLYLSTRDDIDGTINIVQMTIQEMSQGGPPQMTLVRGWTWPSGTTAVPPSMIAAKNGAVYLFLDKLVALKEGSGAKWWDMGYGDDESGGTSVAVANPTGSQQVILFADHLATWSMNVPYLRQNATILPTAGPPAYTLNTQSPPPNTFAPPTNSPNGPVPPTPAPVMPQPTVELPSRIDPMPFTEYQPLPAGGGGSFSFCGPSRRVVVRADATAGISTGYSVQDGKRLWVSSIRCNHIGANPSANLQVDYALPNGTEMTTCALLGDSHTEIVSFNCGTGDVAYTHAQTATSKLNLQFQHLNATHVSFHSASPGKWYGAFNLVTGDMVYSATDLKDHTQNFTTDHDDGSYLVNHTILSPSGSNKPQAPAVLAFSCTEKSSGKHRLLAFYAATGDFAWVEDLPVHMFRKDIQDSTLVTAQSSKYNIWTSFIKFQFGTRWYFGMMDARGLITNMKALELISYSLQYDKVPINSVEEGWFGIHEQSDSTDYLKLFDLKACYDYAQLHKPEGTTLFPPVLQTITVNNIPYDSYLLNFHLSWAYTPLSNRLLRWECKAGAPYYSTEQCMGHLTSYKLNVSAGPQGSGGAGEWQVDYTAVLNGSTPQREMSYSGGYFSFNRVAEISVNEELFMVFGNNPTYGVSSETGRVRFMLPIEWSADATVAPTANGISIINQDYVRTLGLTSGSGQQPSDAASFGIHGRIHTCSNAEKYPGSVFGLGEDGVAYRYETMDDSYTAASVNSKWVTALLGTHTNITLETPKIASMQKNIRPTCAVGDGVVFIVLMPYVFSLDPATGEVVSTQLLSDLTGCGAGTYYAGQYEYKAHASGVGGLYFIDELCVYQFQHKAGSAAITRAVGIQTESTMSLRMALSIDDEEQKLYIGTRNGAVQVFDLMIADHAGKPRMVLAKTYPIAFHGSLSNRDPVYSLMVQGGFVLVAFKHSVNTYYKSDMVLNSTYQVEWSGEVLDMKAWNSNFIIVVFESNYLIWQPASDNKPYQGVICGAGPSGGDIYSTYLDTNSNHLFLLCENEFISVKLSVNETSPTRGVVTTKNAASDSAQNCFEVASHHEGILYLDCYSGIYGYAASNGSYVNTLVGWQQGESNIQTLVSPTPGKPTLFVVTDNRPTGQHRINFLNLNKPSPFHDLPTATPIPTQTSVPVTQPPASVTPPPTSDPFVGRSVYAEQTAQGIEMASSAFSVILQCPPMSTSASCQFRSILRLDRATRAMPNLNADLVLLKQMVVPGHTQLQTHASLLHYGDQQVGTPDTVVASVTVPVGYCEHTAFVSSGLLICFSKYWGKRNEIYDSRGKTNMTAYSLANGMKESFHTTLIYNFSVDGYPGRGHDGPHVTLLEDVNEGATGTVSPGGALVMVVMHEVLTLAVDSSTGDVMWQSHKENFKVRRTDDSAPINTQVGTDVKNQALVYCPGGVDANGNKSKVLAMPPYVAFATHGGSFAFALNALTGEPVFTVMSDVAAFIPPSTPIPWETDAPSNGGGTTALVSAPFAPPREKCTFVRHAQSATQNNNGAYYQKYSTGQGDVSTETMHTHCDYAPDKSSYQAGSAPRWLLPLPGHSRRVLGITDGGTAMWVYDTETCTQLWLVYSQEGQWSGNHKPVFLPGNLVMVEEVESSSGGIHDLDTGKKVQDIGGDNSGASVFFGRDPIGPCDVVNQICFFQYIEAGGLHTITAMAFTVNKTAPASAQYKYSVIFHSKVSGQPTVHTYPLDANHAAWDPKNKMLRYLDHGSNIVSMNFTSLIGVQRAIEANAIRAAAAAKKNVPYTGHVVFPKSIAPAAALYKLGKDIQNQRIRSSDDLLWAAASSNVEAYGASIRAYNPSGKPTAAFPNNYTALHLGQDVINSLDFTKVNNTLTDVQISTPTQSFTLPTALGGDYYTSNCQPAYSSGIILWPTQVYPGHGFATIYSLMIIDQATLESSSISLQELCPEAQGDMDDSSLFLDVALDEDDSFIGGSKNYINCIFKITIPKTVPAGQIRVQHAKIQKGTLPPDAVNGGYDQNIRVYQIPQQQQIVYYSPATGSIYVYDNKDLGAAAPLWTFTFGLQSNILYVAETNSWIAYGSSLLLRQRNYNAQDASHQNTRAAWSVLIGFSAKRLTVLAKEGVVLANGDNIWQCFNATTGDLLWQDLYSHKTLVGGGRHDLNSNGRTTPEHGILMANKGTASLYLVNVLTGHIIWQVRGPTSCDTAVLDQRDPTLWYYVSCASSVYVVDAYYGTLHTQVGGLTVPNTNYDTRQARFVITPRGFILTTSQAYVIVGELWQTSEHHIAPQTAPPTPVPTPVPTPTSTGMDTTVAPDTTNHNNSHKKAAGNTGKAPHKSPTAAIAAGATVGVLVVVGIVGVVVLRAKGKLGGDNERMGLITSSQSLNSNRYELKSDVGDFGATGDTTPRDNLQDGEV